jgi:hypothetical protein
METLGWENQAEGEGFEPSVGFLPHRFSRPEQSAALPPFLSLYSNEPGRPLYSLHPSRAGAPGLARPSTRWEDRRSRYFQSGEHVVENIPVQKTAKAEPAKVGKGSSWLVVGLVAAALVVLGVLLIHEKSPLNLTTLLAGMEHDGRYASEWRKELKHPDKETRRVAVLAVGKMVDKTPSTISTLCAILNDDPESDVRIEAALAMSKIKPDSPEAVNALAKGLKDENLWVRMNCSQTLGLLQNNAAPALPAILEAIKDPKNQEKTSGFFNTIYESLVMTLAKVTAGTPDGVDVVCDALEKATTRQAKVSFIQAVSRIGAPARVRGEPLLEKLKADPDQGISDEATYCLAVLRGEKANPEAPIRPAQKGGSGKGGPGGFPGGDFKGKGGFGKGGPPGFPKGPPKGPETPPEKDGKPADSKDAK